MKKFYARSKPTRVLPPRELTEMELKARFFAQYLYTKTYTSVNWHPSLDPIELNPKYLEGNELESGILLLRHYHSLTDAEYKGVALLINPTIIGYDNVDIALYIDITLDQILLDGIKPKINSKMLALFDLLRRFGVIAPFSGYTVTEIIQQKKWAKIITPQP